MAILGGLVFVLSLVMMPQGLVAMQEDEQLGMVTYDRWSSESNGIDDCGDG